MSSFLESFKSMLAMTQYDLCMENHKTDSRYQELDEEHSELFQKIMDHLEKDRKWMLRLEELESARTCIDDDCIYVQGFLDCVTLLKFLKMI